MPFTAYCLGFGTWTVVPRHWDDAFAHMRDSGFDGVALGYADDQMRYSRRAFEMQVASAHRHGLKVHAIPSRLGGRVAGSPIASWWVQDHPESVIPELPGLACIEDDTFRDYSRDFIHTLFNDYDLDGLIWDEPKSSTAISSHPATIAALGEKPTAEQMAQSFANWLQELTGIARDARPELQVSLFNMPTVSPLFTERCAFIDGLDYLGYDGGFCRQSYYHEPPVKHKHYLPERWERTCRECAGGGKQTFALVENFLMPKGVLGEFSEGLKAYLQEAHPDHLVCYYYGLNNEEPDAVHDAVTRIIRDHYL